MGEQVEYEGGYLLYNEPLVRGFGANGHTANDLSQLSNVAVEAVNLIQETPWAVNAYMMAVINAFVWLGENVTIDTKSGKETVLHLAKPLNPRLDPKSIVSVQFSEEVWAGMDRDQKNAHRKARSKVMTKYEEELGVYMATQRLINTANEMAEFPMFYFPHNMDFRTRIYPIPNDLTPQSNDLSKGLLQFRRGTKLGKEGLFWLGFTMASHWGEDKLSPEGRYQYACDMLLMDMLYEWVDNPIENRDWLHADKPFQFLAAAHEWVWAHRQQCPEDYVSYLPGNLDGSCNGAQHLSIMARDIVGATATNCRSNEVTKGERYDLYMEVADRVWEKVQADAQKGDLLALEWSNKLMEPSDRRKVVKRSVMTVPYGVTEYGVADFMIKDKHVDEKAASQWDSAKYMRDLIMSSIDATLSNGRKLQLWFSECARICAEAGVPLQWDTPAGTKITQAYRNVIMRRIQAFNTKFYIYEEPQEDEDDEGFLTRVGMDVKKMATAAPPNVVHSCDASHLQLTVCEMAKQGIRDFSMIHDSFGCPMAQVGLMRDILRNAVVDMYKDDYLLRWKESVERYSGLRMPNPPAVGQFDIFEILDSEYFFS